MQEIDFSEIIPSENKALRIGSKAYILSHGVMNDEFRLKHIKGDLNGIDRKPEKVRESLNVYSETELENLKRRFLSKGYLEQKEDSAAYTLTEKGMALLQTYVNLAQANQFIKLLEFGRLDDQLQLLTNLRDIRKSPKDMSSSRKEKLLQEMDETGQRPDEIWQEKVKESVKQNYDADSDLDEVVENLLHQVNVGARALIELGADEGSEELEEINSMFKKLTAKPSAPEFGEEDESDLFGKYDRRN